LEAAGTCSWSFFFWFPRRTLKNQHSTFPQAYVLSIRASFSPAETSFTELSFRSFRNKFLFCWLLSKIENNAELTRSAGWTTGYFYFKIITSSKLLHDTMTDTFFVSIEIANTFLGSTRGIPPASTKFNHQDLIDAGFIYVCSKNLLCSGVSNWCLNYHLNIWGFIMYNSISQIIYEALT
jgi:hypothetical protein